MNRLIFLISFFMISIFTMGQQYDDPDELEIVQHSDYKLTDQDSAKSKWNTDLQVGTSFSFSPHNYYGPSYFISPSLTYRATPRFLLTAGVGLQYSNFYPLYKQEVGNSKMLPMTQAFLYARGTYLLSSRITLNSTVYKSITDQPQLTNYSRPIKYNYQGVSVGIHYKVSDSFSFGIQMNMQNSSYDPYSIDNQGFRY